MILFAKYFISFYENQTENVKERMILRIKNKSYNVYVIELISIPKKFN